MGEKCAGKRAREKRRKEDFVFHSRSALSIAIFSVLQATFTERLRDHKVLEGSPLLFSFPDL